MANWIDSYEFPTLSLDEQCAEVHRLFQLGMISRKTMFELCGVSQEVLDGLSGGEDVQRDEDEGSTGAGRKGDGVPQGASGA